MLKNSVTAFPQRVGSGQLREPGDCGTPPATIVMPFAGVGVTLISGSAISIKSTSRHTLRIHRPEAMPQGSRRERRVEKSTESSASSSKSRKTARINIIDMDLLEFAEPGDVCDQLSAQRVQDCFAQQSRATTCNPVR
jgi:hypothetical protein